jgi:hypothetical protein
MIVNRRTFIVKNGRMDEAVEILQSPRDFMENVPPHRMYVSAMGTFNLLAMELEFENYTEYEAFWIAFGKASGRPAMMEKWFDVTLEGGTNEIWELVE